MSFFYEIRSADNTGKERDSESGLDNFGARYNSSQYGRFMSPDPVNAGAVLGFPQSWNGYSYVANNPLSAVDPDGLDCAYLNDSGNDIESVDSNSNSGECTSNGGYWLSGQVNQVSVNDNGSYNFGYNGVGANGTLLSTTYNSYLSPTMNNNTGSDAMGAFAPALGMVYNQTQGLNHGTFYLQWYGYSYLASEPLMGLLFRPGETPDLGTGDQSTGRTIPANLKEQLAMQQAKSNPSAGQQVPITMTDPRWPADQGWVKMSQNVNGVEVHYDLNTKTGETADWKFK